MLAEPIVPEIILSIINFGSGLASVGDMVSFKECGIVHKHCWLDGADSSRADQS